MSYFNFHAIVKKMIKDGKLKSYYVVDVYKDIAPALVLIFNDTHRPVVPIRKHMWDEYFNLIEELNKEYWQTLIISYNLVINEL